MDYLDLPDVSPTTHNTSFLNDNVRKICRTIDISFKIYDKFKMVCQECGTKCRRKKIFEEKDKSLPYAEAHHIVSISSLIKKYKINHPLQAVLFKEFFDENNVTLLCINCHKNTKSYVRG